MLSLFWFWVFRLLYFSSALFIFFKFCGLFTGQTSDLKLFDHAGLEK